MENEKKNNTLRIFVRDVLITAVILSALALLLFSISTQGATQPSGTAEPSETDIPSASEDEFKAIDELLSQAAQGNIAYNAPSNMKLDETVTIQLLLSPAMAQAALATQLPTDGVPIMTTVDITPRMKAELIALDEAFSVKPLHDSAEQVVSQTEPTSWEWLVTSKKGGPQKVSLVLYRLIIFEDKEYWRQVQTYKADIDVNVTLGQRLQALDWKWFAGLLLSSLIIPLIKQWLDSRKEKKSTRRKSSD